jgi:hypothetical protein
MHMKNIEANTYVRANIASVSSRRKTSAFLKEEAPVADVLPGPEVRHLTTGCSGRRGAPRLMPTLDGQNTGKGEKIILQGKYGC